MPLMPGTKRRDKLAADFTCLYQIIVAMLITATVQKTDIVYMNAIFISRNGPFITVFSALRLIITYFSLKKIKLKKLEASSQN
ncbi:hypothetical protein AIA82_01650 [Salmonella enterica subsp. enterica serovar Montevideo]|uniref:Uncharacterized protein n=4 Tax=Salmonella enterica TaxID=28901 RepID=A0A628NC57_SALMO|nr:hypothetical protein [Salmonella enterica]EBA2372732.1 hypothetical protein [Salmonella enterica subsp. enterica serovar Dublin]EBB2929530.1 hypothetical protein [Salmonella enterica subsp. enterica serovar Montevideo]ECH6551927.1 hypothetical protein [Salmonella enterica subsp. enterica]EDD5577359.1 hypothetical protein [Salmonella enterica subsp. enterica serovar Enteritidis]HAE2649773.1 hypothetical protein [Salmonella enterica subsp. enterica serovar 6,7,14:g,m[p],s:[1,2,7]]